MTTLYAEERTSRAIRCIGESPKNERPAIPERLLWKLWKRRAARQDEFRTGAGGRLRVLYPGRSGTSAGPDFRDALLEIEGLGLVRGDVEIHLRQRDWAAHGHGDDPNYNGVVIHGALEVESPETALHSGMAAPMVSLSGLLDGADDGEPADFDETPADFDETKVTSGLWNVLARRGYPQPESVVEAAELLDRAGDERFLRKAALLGRFSGEQGPEQTLFEALMEGLGYRQNQTPFVKLAQAAPIAALRRAALPVLAEQRPMVLRHWLLAVSGLAAGATATPSRLPIGLGPAMERKEWHLFRVRPANHPAARIEGAAQLVARYLDRGLVAGLADASRAPSQLIAALTVDEGSGGSAAIGAGRARDLAVNALLPLLHSLSGSSESLYLTLYQRFPKLQGNEVVREMAEQLLPEAWRTQVNNARRQQGLLRLAALLRGGG